MNMVPCMIKGIEGRRAGDLPELGRKEELSPRSQGQGTMEGDRECSI